MEKRVNAATAAEIISQYTGIPLHQLVDIMAEVPSEDVEPVRHGHWIRPDVPNTRSYKWQCSECGQIAYWLHYGNRGNINIICKYSYCPHCGAKMDGDKNG